jgi:hypothetical protein
LSGARIIKGRPFRVSCGCWAYCGLALETRDSGEYRVVNGQVERKRKPALIRGLNWNHNHEMEPRRN